MGIDAALRYIQDFQGSLTVMEVCGTHTAAIADSGLRALLPNNIRLVSGPGCPVCVTPAAVIDRLVALSKTPEHCVLSFGDMLRVPGTAGSLSSARAEGGHVQVVYSPFEAVRWARERPDTRFILAAVGFETTAPLYAALLETLAQEGVGNVRLLTAIKTIPPALRFICETGHVDGFICPGHVSAVVGAQTYTGLCERYQKPFIIAGFESEHIIAALCLIIYQHQSRRFTVENLYPSAVSFLGNPRAQLLMERYFEPVDALWRGIGRIAKSGLQLRPEWAAYDAGGVEEREDMLPDCRCGEVMLGQADPPDCPRFGVSCRPLSPVGACMVTREGACGIWYAHREAGV